MSAMRLAAFVLYALTANGLANASPVASETNSADVVSFSRLLQSVSEQSLHAILDIHLGHKFKQGVFENDGRDALSAVHSENPSLATRLVDLAKREAVFAELEKRQTANTTVVTTTSVTTSTTSPTTATTTSKTAVVSATTTSSSGSTVTTSVTSVPTGGDQVSTTSTISGVIEPVSVSSTNSDGSVVVSTTSSFVPASDVTASLTVSVTTTNSQGSTITTGSVVAAVVQTSTNAQGSVTVMTSPVPSAVIGPSGIIIPVNNAGSVATGRDITTTDSLGNTAVFSDVVPGDVVTATDAAGHTIVTTYTPSGSHYDRTVLITTTLPDGQRKTITSFEVGSGATGTASAVSGATDSASTSHRTPGLQSGVSHGAQASIQLAMFFLAAFLGFFYSL